MKPEAVKLRPSRRYILVVLVLLLALYVLAPQVGDFHSSWRLLRRPEPGWTIAAIGFTLTTYLSAASNYWLLALRPLSYGRTVVVQLAAMFINRLLPGGVGALGVNYAYLRRQGLGGTNAASVVALNNLMGVAGNGLLVVSLVFLFARTSTQPDYGHTVGTWLKVTLLAAIVLVVVLLALGPGKYKKQFVKLRAQLSGYRRQPWRLPAALGSSMLLTLGNVLCLGACALALGVHLPFAIILLILTLGVGAGAATPTPGGLGGFEAGLAAGFVAYGVDSSAALAVALLYRLVSYWLPIIFGAPALVVCRRRSWF